MTTSVTCAIVSIGQVGEEARETLDEAGRRAKEISAELQVTAEETIEEVRTSPWVQLELLTNWGLGEMADISQATIWSSESAEKYCILIQSSLSLIPNGLINNKPELVEIMDWRRTGDTPLSGAMLAQVPDAYTLLSLDYFNYSWPIVVLYVLYHVLSDLFCAVLRSSMRFLCYAV